MSRLKELVATLCPDGVEYKKLGAFAECFSGATPRKKNPEYWNDGTIPWMSSGEVHQHVVRHVEGHITQLGYDSCSTRMVPVGTVLVALAGQGKTRGTVAITEIELCTNQSIGAILCSDSVDSKYLYYYLSGQYDFLRRISSGEGTRGGLNMPLIRDLDIPVPPIEVQREIVRILDSFQELDDALTAEIEAREKQLCAHRNTYYGDLLSVNSLVKMESCISHLRTGLNPRKNFVLNTTDAANYYVTVRELEGFDVVPSDKTDLVNDEALRVINNRSQLKVGDLLFSGVGTVGKTAIVESEPTDWNIKEGVYAVTPDYSVVTSLYLLHYLVSDVARSRFLGGVDGGTVASLSMASFKKLDVPLVALYKQNDVVYKFEAERLLINMLRSERDARRKQFAYYRDKLLDLPEKVTTNG